MATEEAIATRAIAAQLMTVVELASVPGSAWRLVINASITAAIT